MTEVIISLIGGCILGWIVCHFQKKSIMQTKEQLYLQQIEDTKLQAQRQIDENRALFEKNANEQKLLAEKHCEDLLNAQQSRFDETIAKVTAQMKGATEEMLKQRQKEFAESSNSNLGQIVNPLKETIDRMKEVMNDSTVKQTAIGTELKANIENMIRQSVETKNSTDELARIFKRGSKVQGDWGETILDELLQSQGLTQGIHYDVQTSMRDANGDVIKTDENKILRPDVILHLDQKRDIIIDAKVSMNSFIDYINAENETDKMRHLKAHITSIRTHAKELAAKDYSSYIKPPKINMGYVIMFVPNSNALWTALNSEPELWREAMNSNVFIADEQTLYSAIKMITLTWTQIKQAENHEKVYELADEMVKRIGMFLKYYKEMGDKLTDAREKYEDGIKKLSDGKQSIIKTANKLLELGASQDSKFPVENIPNGDETKKIE